MKEKKYEFYGVDFKTELLLGVIAGIVLLLIWFGLLLIYYKYFNLDSILRISKLIFFLCMIIGFSVSMFLLRTMGIIYRNNWIIIDNHDEFTITYKNKLWKLDKKDICKINYLGNEAFRYLSFF
jgi:hypothetical protein